MLSSLVMCLAVAGRLSADSPSPNHQFPALPLSGTDIDSFCRDRLERARRGRIFLEETIKWQEKMIQEPDFYTQEEADHIRQQVAGWRENLEFLKQHEQILEWYERQRKVNPGPDTEQAMIDRLEKLLKEWDGWREFSRAPMPREVKK